MFNWLTPNVQKGIALSFVFSWFLAQHRFMYFWQALSGQVTLGTSSGSVGIIGTTVLPDLPGGQGEEDEPPDTPELPEGPGTPELPAGGDNPEPIDPTLPIPLPSELPFF